MPRDWLREERDDRGGRWNDPHRPSRSEDLGQADFSTDYGYDVDRREGRRAADDLGRRREDYGQADYSTDFAYDPERGEAYRRFRSDDRVHDRDADRIGRDPDLGERRSFFGGRAVAERGRRGPSDRVLWAVIVERLEDVRGLDLRDVEVLVDNAEVTLNGTVRRKEDKRRIEDVADLDGVRHVQNNLRVREGLRRWF
jgi:hypothetical protein